ncbi:MAG: response regulator [Pseudomonadota bacterium]
MRYFERASLGQKLTIVCLLATGSALLLVFAAYTVSTVLSHRKEESAQLASLAGVIGANSGPALLAREPKRASAILAALGAREEISGAALYARDGTLFARYRASAQDGELAEPVPGAPVAAASSPAAQWPIELAAAGPDDDAAQAAPFWSARMRVQQAVLLDQQVVGSVLIEADLVPMWRDIAKSLGVLGAAMLAALVVASAMSARFKASIADPISKLISAAHKVSSSQNTTLRIAHQRSDELGTLIDSFNDMLAQLEGRGAALSHHRDELERQVGVRTAQLEKAKNAAEAASRAKSAFLATMSHEIRTPMNGVLGMADMLLGTQLSDTQRNYTSMVKRSGEHLLVIINDILDFSKIEAGKLTIEYIQFNLWDLLDDIDKAFTPQAQAKHIALEFAIAPDIPIAVYGDPNRLRQIMANLLGNAIKFTERGAITAKVRLASEDSQGVVLRFEVHDTGIGVSREARERIFDAFSQADNSTTRKYGGTGLGLAISKQLVELMGGKIGIDNALAQGSLFWFTVSFDKRGVALGDAAPFTATAEIRALIVDEHSSSRAALARQLAMWSVRCSCAERATDALEQLCQAARAGTPFDVAVLDMELARTSGLALAAAIKAEPATRGTRIVLLSSERCAADPQQRREAGVAYQLIKPAREGDLFECVAIRARGAAAPLALAAPAPPPIPAAATTRARRRRVLLAEDNPVNVEVASAMLESLGLDVVCARNGEQAVAAVRAAHGKNGQGGQRGYDVVLMDCQMPVMDGFAATGAIRRHEQQQRSARAGQTSLPIIAITANALQGDRETCLAAGMDDYLSKPFTQQELASVIGRWIALPPPHPGAFDETPASLVEDSAPAPASAAGAPLNLAVASVALAAARSAPAHPARDAINRDALANIRALSRERGDALVQKVILAYVDDTPAQLQTLRLAIAAVDAATLRKAAHSLKSSSANVGAEALAQLCKEMESLGRGASTAGAATILNDMEQEFQAVRHCLNAILEKET